MFCILPQDRVAQVLPHSLLEAVTTLQFIWLRQGPTAAVVRAILLTLRWRVLRVVPQMPSIQPRRVRGHFLLAEKAELLALSLVQLLVAVPHR